MEDCIVRVSLVEFLKIGQSFAVVLFKNSVDLAEEIGGLSASIGSLAGDFLELLEAQHAIPVGQKGHDWTEDPVALGHDLGEVVVQALAKEDVLVGRLELTALF